MAKTNLGITLQAGDFIKALSTASEAFAAMGNSSIKAATTAGALSKSLEVLKTMVPFCDNPKCKWHEQFAAPGSDACYYVVRPNGQIKQVPESLAQSGLQTSITASTVQVWGLPLEFIERAEVSRTVEGYGMPQMVVRAWYCSCCLNAIHTILDPVGHLYPKGKIPSHYPTSNPFEGGFQPFCMNKRCEHYATKVQPNIMNLYLPLKLDTETLGNDPPPDAIAQIIRRKPREFMIPLPKAPWETGATHFPLTVMLCPCCDLAVSAHLD